MRRLETGIIIALLGFGSIVVIDIYLWISENYLAALFGVGALCWLWPNSVSPALED